METKGTHQIVAQVPLVLAALEAVIEVTEAQPAERVVIHKQAPLVVEVAAVVQPAIQAMVVPAVTVGLLAVVRLVEAALEVE